MLFQHVVAKKLFISRSNLAARRPDYQVTIPLGITGPGQTEPIFTVQVVASGVLLRGALLPQVETLAAVSGGALLISLLLTLLSTNRVLRPLKRIEPYRRPQLEPRPAEAPRAVTQTTPAKVPVGTPMHPAPQPQQEREDLEIPAFLRRRV